MKKVGQITLDGKTTDLYINEDSATQPQAPVVSQPTGDGFVVKSITVADNGSNKRVSWDLVGGSGNYSYKLGSDVYPTTLMFAPNNVQWDVTIIDNVTRKEYPIRIDTSKVGTVNFNVTGRPIEAKPVVEKPKVTLPVVTNNQRYEAIPFGVETEIKSGKVLVQISSDSHGQGHNSGLYSKFSKDGVEIVSVETKDNQLLPGAVYNNNHMNAYQIVFPEGEIQFDYTHTSERGLPITLGMGEIHNNEGYTFYKNTSVGIFAKKVEKGESFSTKFRIEEKDDYGVVNGKNLHKYAWFNFIKDGKIYHSNLEINFGDGTWYPYHGNFEINSKSNVTVRSKENKNAWVQFEIKVGDTGNTGSVKVIAKSEVDLCEKLFKISKWRREYANGSSPQGIKDVTYKQYNNFI